MNAIADKIPRWAISGVVGVIVFAAGFVTNYYVDYRSQYVEALNANYEQFDKASEDIRETLKVFADIARGDKPKSSDNLNALQMELLVAVGKVEDLSRRVDGGATFVKVYQDAAVNLRNAAERSRGRETER